MRALRALLFALLLSPAATAQVRDTVYADALGARWFAGGWPCLDNADVAIRLDAPGDDGGTAVEADHRTCGAGGWGAISFDRRTSDWSVRHWMYPNQTPVLAFRLNPGADPEALRDLQVIVDVADETVRPLWAYLPSSLAPNAWVDVSIPLADIATTGAPFARFVFWNTGSRLPHYRVDDLVLTFAPDMQAPVLADVTVDAGPDSATVRWRTDEFTRGTLVYGPPGATQTVASNAFAREHVVRIGGLAPSTAYPFTLTAEDHQEGDIAPNTATATGTITTTAPDAMPPALDGAVDVDVRSDRAVVAVRTTEPAEVRVEASIGGAYDRSATSGLGYAHRVVLSGLAPETAYRYRLVLRDRFGNETTVTPSPVAFTTAATPTATLAVDAGAVGRPFTRDVLGHNLGQWTFMWGRVHPADSPLVRELTRLIRPGVLRYAGGLLSNDVTWDRASSQRYPAGWRDLDGDGVRETWSGRDYYSPARDGVDRCGAVPVAKPRAYVLGYQADEVDRMAAFARYVGADVMVEVDVTTCDPGLWADMVRYANAEKGYGWRYWELGNELDLERVNGKADVPLGPAYVDRFRRYADSLHAVDPTVAVAGPTTASIDTEDTFFRPYADFMDPLTADPATRGRLGLFTAHLYPLWRPAGSRVGYREMFGWTHPEPSRGRSFTATHIGRLRMLLDMRGLGDVPIGITEFSAMAYAEPTTFVSNHAGALYHADMLGRLAAAGTDVVTNWLLYDLDANVTGYGLVNHHDRMWIARDMGTDAIVPPTDAPSVNPIYYTYFGYAHLFGDRLVTASSSLDTTLSVWASTDTRSPGAVKLLLTNLADEPVDATVDLAGVTATDARRFDLASPGFLAAPDDDRDHAFPSTLNGLSLDVGSPAALVASARTILASGRPVAVENGGTRLRLRVGPYEAVWVLVNQPTPLPLAEPMLLEAPIALATSVPTDAPPTLGWRSAVGAYEYTVEVAPAPAGTTPDFGAALVFPRLSETHLAPGGLAPRTRYAARVRSDGRDGPSAWTDLGTFESGGALPVELTAFTARTDGARVRLAWTTASETNNAGWDVEARRLDGDGGWAILRRVAGAGMSVETRRYAVTLDSLAPGRWAFRLRQTDLDGTATLSPETTATLDAPRVLALTAPAPNPVRGTATLRYTVPTDGRAEVTVFDVAGRRVATLTDAVVTAGAEHRVVVDAGTLAPGLYVVRLRHAAGVRARAVTVVR